MEIKGINTNLPVKKAEARDSDVLSRHVRNDGEKRVEVNQKDAAEAAETVKVPDRASYKAFFAVDESKNVVIRVVDGEGNIVKQIPPEEYMKTMEALKMNRMNLLDKEA